MLVIITTNLMSWLDYIAAAATAALTHILSDRRSVLNHANTRRMLRLINKCQLLFNMQYRNDAQNARVPSPTEYIFNGPTTKIIHFIMMLIIGYSPRQIEWSTDRKANTIHFCVRQ